MAHTPVRSSNRNPLAIDPEREQRIRERAYHLWEADGKPHGHDVEYWERARELVGIEESAGSGLLPDPVIAPAPPREIVAKDGGVQADLGRSPDRPADQGGRKPTPRRPGRAKAGKPA